MVRIAPVRLSFNPKTLWFDAGELELSVNDSVVVSTARGTEFGTVANPVFDLDYEETKKLKSPLKPVKRLASEEDIAQDAKNAELSALALPIYKQIANETIPDINPIAVEYLFDGDKAVFYFESEERVDFRDLVRKLASEFHIRVDMKQIGVRDEARLIGGLGHCGQELCCRRLGAGFDPVSIRMAKEQDLSLNPQKISGVCGRLMCCLRYEYEAYKDFHGRAPKKNAKIQTPDGEGKVIDMNVPREIITVKVGDEKPVKVPLADFEEPDEGAKPNVIGEEAWQRANEPAVFGMESALSLFTNELSGEDKLAQPGQVRHVHEEGSEKKSSRSRSRRRGSKSSVAKDEAAAAEKTTQRKPRRRRSTTVASDGSTQVVEQQDARQSGQKQQQKPSRSSRQRTKQGGDSKQAPAKESTARDRKAVQATDDATEQRKPSRRRRSRSKTPRNQASEGKSPVANAPEQQSGASKVGRNSSALRANRSDAQAAGTSHSGENAERSGASSSRRRRRRTHSNTETHSEE